MFKDFGSSRYNIADIDRLVQKGLTVFSFDYVVNVSLTMALIM